jgi:hypothetical protein
MSLDHIYELAFFFVFIALLFRYAGPALGRALYGYEVRRAKILTDQADVLEKLQLQTYKLRSQHDAVVHDMTQLPANLRKWQQTQIAHVDAKQNSAIDSYLAAKQAAAHHAYAAQRREIARTHFRSVVSDIQKAAQANNISFTKPMSVIEMHFKHLNSS